MKPSERIAQLMALGDHRSLAVTRYLDEIHAVLDKYLQVNLGMGIDSVGTEPRSRWVEIVATSNSGKRQWVCRCCGRVSVTPDKECARHAHVVHVGQETWIDCAEWEKENLR
jgi:hypothetical protein